ncbi:MULTISPECIES: hypothetical protein [unclassified Nocardiopsis]|uniref:hypothetical protein n=1 Tax=Nocardiopsis TaxID=2013 RepID=UPI00387B6FC2
MNTRNGEGTTTTPRPQAPLPGPETDENRYLRGLPAPSVLDRGRRRLALASLRRPVPVPGREAV